MPNETKDSDKVFGDYWHRQRLEWWERMAKRSEGPATDRLVEMALGAKSLFEVGCGAGHLITKIVEAGFKGTYWGFDISERAVAETKRKVQPLEDAHVVSCNFITLTSRSHLLRPDVELAISRDVVQHQAHWMPMVMAMLRFAPRAIIALTRPKYWHKQGDRHIVTERTGFYDVSICLELLLEEACAVGLKTTTYESENKIGREVLIIFERSDE